MNVQFSGIEPTSVDRRQDPAAGAAQAAREQGARPAAAEARGSGPREGGSTRVTVSAEARARLAAEETTGAREEARKAAEDKGAVARLLETQKERVASAGKDNALQPPPTRPSPEDRGSIRAAEQRLAAAGLTT
ncbi:MAG: hypothetical protein ACOYMX_08090 [Burkholderiales bacterium]